MNPELQHEPAQDERAPAGPTLQNSGDDQRCAVAVRGRAVQAEPVGNIRRRQFGRVRTEQGEDLADASDCLDIGTRRFAADLGVRHC
jgi:hypothetical protein